MASGAVFDNILKGILREILQIFGGHIVFDIVPGEVGIDDGVCFGYRLFPFIRSRFHKTVLFFGHAITSPIDCPFSGKFILTAVLPVKMTRNH